MNVLGIWTGWWDEQKEGEWVSVLDSSKVLKNQSFKPYKLGEPNGLTMENCGRLRINRNVAVWEDVNCEATSERSCVACQIPLTPVFVLRGILLFYVFVMNCFLKSTSVKKACKKSTNTLEFRASTIFIMKYLSYSNLEM